MGRIDWRNMSLRILSLFLAVLLWLYVTNEQNPLYSQIFTVSLHQQGLAQGMAVSGSIPHTVNIRVQGTRGQVSALSAADFDALLDMSGLVDGEHDVRVKVESPPGVQVAQISPDKVSVVLDSIVEQQVQVTAALKGSPATGYSALNPVVLPQVVTVKGPRTKVSAVTQLGVTVDVEGVTKNVEKVLPVIAPPGLTIYPQNVKVTVPVAQLSSKSVPVRPGILGTPAVGYQAAAAVSTPGEVQITAPPEVLAGIKWVDTDSVSIDGASSDVTAMTAVILPAGAVVVSPAAVNITVHIDKTQVKPGDTGTAQSTAGQ